MSENLTYENQLEKHVQLIKDHLGNHRVKNAILVDSPIETAIAIFYQDMAIKVHKIKIFSTEEGALNWLKIPLLGES